MMRSWWHAWRRRRRLERLERLLDPARVTAADHSSAALVAVLTERIARINAGHVSADQLTTTIHVAQRAYEDCQAEVARCRGLRDSAQAEATEWRSKVMKALRHDCPDLASLAQERVLMWERRERDADAELGRGIGSLNRLADAISELSRLAMRLESAPQSKP